jgi:cytochrome c biogenesis protein
MTRSTAETGFTGRIWKFFASVKLSVVLLLALAATSIIGTVIPQGASPMMYLQRYGETLYHVFDALSLFDMYHAWWFRLLLALLTVNIIVCSVDRLRATWKIIFPRKINFQPGRFRKSGSRVEWSEAAPVEDLADAYQAYIERRFRHVAVQEKEDGRLIFGEKGRWTRLGVYAVHSSILLLVIGGLIGSLFGFEGYVNIPEGDSASRISLKKSNEEKELPFAIRCEDFFLSHYDSGMPKEYRSTVTILNDGEVVRKADIRVNDPLQHEGINIFQSSYGRVPDDQFTLVFTNPESGMEYERPASLGAEIEMPENKGTLVVQDFSTGFSFRGHNIGEAFLCRLAPAGSREGARNIIIPVSFPRFDRMRGGDFVISVKDVEFGYYTGLQVTRDPGVPVVYAGFILIIIGCYITFFMQHRQVGLELSARGEQTDVLAACVSGKNRPGMKAATRRLAQQLKQLSKT